MKHTPIAPIPHKFPQEDTPIVQKFSHEHAPILQKCSHQDTPIVLKFILKTHPLYEFRDTFSLPIFSRGVQAAWARRPRHYGGGTGRGHVGPDIH